MHMLPWTQKRHDVRNQAGLLACQYATASLPSASSLQPYVFSLAMCCTAAQTNLNKSWNVVQACALSQRLEQCVDEECRAVCDFGFNIMQQACVLVLPVPAQDSCLYVSLSAGGQHLVNVVMCFPGQDAGFLGAQWHILSGLSMRTICMVVIMLLCCAGAHSLAAGAAGGGISTLQGGHVVLLPSHIGPAGGLPSTSGSSCLFISCLKMQCNTSPSPQPVCFNIVNTCYLFSLLAICIQLYDTVLALSIFLLCVWLLLMQLLSRVL